MYLGSWKIDDLLTFPCNTHSTTGAATDADSAPSYRVYEDETSTAILTGSMALLDSSNTAGLYSEQITLSAANGLESGKSYTIYISATVGGITGTMSHTFQIGAEVDANILVRKNTALSNFMFLMRDSSDHITPKTGLTVTAERSIDGAAFGACANSVSEVANGVYKINLAAADLNGNVVTLKFTATGADQRTITFITQQ